MENLTAYIMIGLGLAMLAGLYLMFTTLSKRIEELQKQKGDAQNNLFLNLSQRMDHLSQHVGESLQNVTNTVMQQLSETGKRVDSRLHSSDQNWLKSAQEIRKSIDHNVQTIREVTGKLAQMDESNKRIFEVGKDIASLQEILRAPKLRGTLGELFLGNLLDQIFPKDRYKLQYSFKSGESVDAVLLLRDGQIVCIDAKFPLESFKRMLDSDEESAKKEAKKQFVVSVKKRIDEIAQKYINPDEGTLDFALMYIPAENVYYETIIKDETGADLINYAYGKRVIPVSPNNLYVYLQTIALGLRGMQIEERAREILKDLSSLNTEYGKVAESYEVLGKHLSSAVSRYDETNKYLAKFGTKIEQIEDKSQVESLPIKTESTDQ